MNQNLQHSLNYSILTVLAVGTQLTACGSGGTASEDVPASTPSITSTPATTSTTPTPSPVASPDTPSPAPAAAPDAVDKSVGTWSGCDTGLTSKGNVKVVYNIGKSIENTGTVIISTKEGNASALVGYTDTAFTLIKPLTALKLYGDVTNFAIVGTHVVGGQPADKIDFSNARGTGKLTFATSVNQFQIGWANPGADGYPTTLNSPLSRKTELVPQFRFLKLTHPLDYLTDRNGVIDWVFF